MTYVVRPLEDTHELGGFSCGNVQLDEWLHEHARAATRQATRTYVMLDEAGVEIPAILLAKLAIDRRLPGRGLGSELLIIALEHMVRAARTAGGKVVVLDAIDEPAARF